MPNLLEEIQRRTLEEHGFTPDERGHYVATSPEVVVTAKKLSPQEVKIRRIERGEESPVIELGVNPMLLPGIAKGLQFVPKALQWVSKTRYVAPVINWGRRIITSKPARVVGEIIDTAISPRNWVRGLGWGAKKVGLEGVGSAIQKAEPAITSGYWGYGLIDDISHPKETSWWEYPLDATFTLGSANRLRKAYRLGNYLEFPLIGTGGVMGWQHLQPLEFTLDRFGKPVQTDEEILNELLREYGGTE